MGKTRGAVAAITAAGLGLLAVQPLAGTAAVVPQHAPTAAGSQLSVPATTASAVAAPTKGSVNAPEVAAPTKASVNVPAVTVPSVSVPKVTTPTVTTPVKTPTVTTPKVTTPTVTTPVKTPTVTTPKVTTPTVTTPVKTPTVTTPIKTPTVTTPKVTTPTVTTPRVGTPVTTVPSVTTPSTGTPSAGTPAGGRQGATGTVRTTASQIGRGLGAGIPSHAGGAQSSASPAAGASGASSATGLPGTLAAAGASGGADSIAGSAGAMTDVARAARIGAATPGSPRAQHLAAVAETRRLRRLVARLRNCLSTIGARARRVLALRAGLHGKARSAATTARILHISDRREHKLERRAVIALAQRAGTSCAGATSAPMSTTSEMTPVGAVSSAPSQSAASASGATLTGARGSRSGAAKGGRGASMDLAPSGAHTEQAGTGSASFPSAILTALLGLMLAVALVVVPKLRGHPSLVGATPAIRRRPSATEPESVLAALEPGPRFSEMDPAVGPMAAQVFDQMADEDARPPEPDDGPAQPPEDVGLGAEET